MSACSFALLAFSNCCFFSSSFALIVSAAMPINPLLPVPVRAYSPVGKLTRRTLLAWYFTPPLISVSDPIIRPSVQRKPAQTVIFRSNRLYSWEIGLGKGGRLPILHLPIRAKVAPLLPVQIETGPLLVTSDLAHSPELARRWSRP